MFLKNMFFKQLFRRDVDKTSPPAPDSARGFIIGVINQKGGCGKTTTVVNLAACLAELGKRVLIVDADPQGHATLGLGFKLGASDKNMYHILVNPEAHISSIIRQTYHPHLDLAPSSAMLSSAQIDLISLVGREDVLRHKLHTVRPDYNFIIIDCPPSLNLLTINVLVAASRLIVPIQTHFYSLDGMSELLKTINIVKQRFNPELGVLGVLPTLFDRRMKVNIQVLEAVRTYFAQDENIRIFNSIIHTCVSLIESPIYGRPVIRHRPKSRGSEDYWNLAKEIKDMLEMEREVANIANGRG